MGTRMKYGKRFGPMRSYSSGISFGEAVLKAQHPPRHRPVSKLKRMFYAAKTHAIKADRKVRMPHFSFEDNTQEDDDAKTK